VSNPGAWLNRNEQAVFTVMEFLDEAAIYDFHVYVLPIAVSICDHAETKGLSEHQALHVFTDSYVDTVVGYVGNETTQLFDFTLQRPMASCRHS
jgi:hypothetical protein